MTPVRPAPRALVIEDAPELRLVLSAQLRRLGFEVRALSDGDHAVAVAQEFCPDIVCLDLMLPNLCGLEVCEALRSTPQTAGVPIVVTSARTSPQDRAHAELAGADAYLTKPVGTDALAATVQALLGRSARVAA